MTSEINKKLDKILYSIEAFTKRIDSLDSKVETLDARLTTLEKNVNSRFNAIESSLIQKATEDDLTDALERIEKSEETILEKRNAVMKESYEKRFNILIHGLDESNDSAW